MLPKAKTGPDKTVFCGPQKPLGAGWSSPVARQAHNLKAAGSNPAPATRYIQKSPNAEMQWGFLAFWASKASSFSEKRRVSSLLA
jgi:hypothetical protein